MKYTAFDTDFLFDYHERSKRLGTHTLTAHYHNLWEIYYITEGKCKYSADGKTYLLKAGDMIIIPGGSVHNTEYVNTIHSRMLINCSDEFIPECLRDGLKNRVTLFRNTETADEIGYAFRKISQIYFAKPPYLEEILRTYTHLVLFAVANNPNQYTEIENDHIQKALEYIKGNFEKNISLHDVAKVCNISSGHLSRLFSAQLGIPFCEFITTLRLKKSEKLLRQRTDLTVAAISAKCGFNDSNYFSMQFKRYYGISASEFRKIK